MADDDASVFRAARDAAGYSENHLKQAQKSVSAARKEFVGGYFKGAVGVASFRTVGEHLARRGDECATAYKRLMRALDDAEHAVENARRACSSMEDAAGT